jgi:hypothetical protein
MRLQLDLSEAKVRDLDRIMEECNISTRKELFNNALTLLEWAVGERKRGNTIASVNEERKTFRELQMPILNNVAAANPEERTTRGAARRHSAA